MGEQAAEIEDLRAQLRGAEAAQSNAILSKDLELAREKREAELLEKAMESILPSHRTITSSPQGFSGVKAEHLAHLKAMDRSHTETKLHRVKVALTELERTKADADADIAAAVDAAAKKVAAAQHQPVITDAQARLREIVVEEIDDCASRRRINAVLRLESHLVKLFPPSFRKKEFQALPKTQEALDIYVQAMREEHKHLANRTQAAANQNGTTSDAAKTAAAKTATAKAPAASNKRKLAAEKIKKLKAKRQRRRLSERRWPLQQRRLSLHSPNDTGAVATAGLHR